MSNKEKNFFRYIGKYLNNDGKIDYKEFVDYWYSK